MKDMRMGFPAALKALEPLRPLSTCFFECRKYPLGMPRGLFAEVDNKRKAELARFAAARAFETGDHGNGITEADCSQKVKVVGAAWRVDPYNWRYTATHWREDVASRGMEYMLDCARAIPHQWIEHDGGECPVPPETKVIVRLRLFPGSAAVPAGSWRWDHQGGSGDIVAWRPA